MLRQSLSSCEHIATYHILFLAYLLQFTPIYILLLYILVLFFAISFLKYVVLIQSCLSHGYVLLTTNNMSVLGNVYNRYAIAFDFLSRLWYNTEYVDSSYRIMASTLDNRHRFVVIITRNSIAHDIALDPMRG